MANLTETGNYDAGVYQIETTDPVTGGPTGIANKAAINLANRTKWLKDKYDAMVSGTDVPAGVAAKVSPGLTGTPTAPTAAAGTNTTQLATTAFVINERSTTATLSGKTLTGLRETRVAVAASAIDLVSGNIFTKTISGATTFTLSNVPAAGTTVSFMLDLTNGGSAAVTWWSGVKWAGGVTPTLTASGRDVLGFFTHDAGTTWTGLLLARDVK